MLGKGIVQCPTHCLLGNLVRILVELIVPQPAIGTLDLELRFSVFIRTSKAEMPYPITVKSLSRSTRMSMVPLRTALVRLNLVIRRDELRMSKPVVCSMRWKLTSAMPIRWAWPKNVNGSRKLKIDGGIACLENHLTLGTDGTGWLALAFT